MDLFKPITSFLRGNVLFHEILLLCAELIAVTVSMIATGKRYGIKKSKCTILGVSLTVIGLASSILMGYVVERGNGMSLYGAVLFAPIFMVPIGLLLKMKIPDVMDLCAPSGVLSLSVGKINCLLNGCCQGRFLFFFGPKNIPVWFPSQIVECLNTLILYLILFSFVRKSKHRGVLYLWAMIYYAVTRFGLTYLRDLRDPFVWIFPTGAFWSLVTLTIAIPLMVVYKRNRHAKTDNGNPNNC